MYSKRVTKVSLLQRSNPQNNAFLGAHFNGNERTWWSHSCDFWNHMNFLRSALLPCVLSLSLDWQAFSRVKVCGRSSSTDCHLIYLTYAPAQQASLRVFKKRQRKSKRKYVICFCVPKKFLSSLFHDYFKFCGYRIAGTKVMQVCWSAGTYLCDCMWSVETLWENNGEGKLRLNHLSK